MKTALGLVKSADLGNRYLATVYSDDWVARTYGHSVAELKRRDRTSGAAAPDKTVVRA